MRKIYINKIEELERILKYGEIELSNLNKDSDGSLIELNIFDDNSISIIYDDSKAYYRAFEIAKERTLFGIFQLIAIIGIYIPVYDKNNNLIFTKENYDLIRSKMDGLSHYGNNKYTFSNNLDFPGIEDYIKNIEDNIIVSNRKREKIVSLLKKELLKKSITLGIGSDNRVDVYLIDIGSTGRATNIINDADFDFIAKVSPRIINNPDRFFDLERVIVYAMNGSINENLHHRGIRNISCNIDGFKEPIKVDITFASSDKEIDYTTESAIIDRLETMKKVNFDNYLKVVANIVYAKKFLKGYGVYKSSRSNKHEAGLGGVGIENLILQNGGSFYDAACEFLSYADGKDFLEFEKTYPLFDFGKNYVSVEKNYFPYDNFIMKNMRQNGYYKMCDALKEYVNYYEKEMKSDERRKRSN